jgi:hypothetical protein
VGVLKAMLSGQKASTPEPAERSARNVPRETFRPVRIVYATREVLDDDDDELEPQDEPPVAGGEYIPGRRTVPTELFS